MGLLRYSEDELRPVLSRAISIRWPRERLLIVTPCSAERVADRSPPAPATSSTGRRGREHHVPPRKVDGFLAATQARLLYQERTSSMSVVKGGAALFAFIALSTLLLHADLLGFAVTGSLATLIWGGGRAVEPLAVARADFSFDRITVADSFSQRFEGFGPLGELYTLHVPNPSDFLMIAAMVAGEGQASAA